MKMIHKQLHHSRNIRSYRSGSTRHYVGMPQAAVERCAFDLGVPHAMMGRMHSNILSTVLSQRFIYISGLWQPTTRYLARDIEGGLPRVCGFGLESASRSALSDKSRSIWETSESSSLWRSWVFHGLCRVYLRSSRCVSVCTQHSFGAWEIRRRSGF